jgi:squalene synthase HpnC
MNAAAPALQHEPSVARTRQAGENFHVAPLLLGRRTCAHLDAVYAFARLVDELGDTADGDRLALLDTAERELDRAFAGEATVPIFRVLTRTIHECGLPREPLAKLIDANRRDQLRPQYDTFGELLDYCELSANPVGLLVLDVLGVKTPLRVALSNAVCTGLQLIEHWQDVGEDARRGRIYLPREDRLRFGVDDGDLTAARATPALRHLLAFETERAEDLLSSGAPLVRSLRGRPRLAIAGYVAGGQAAAAALRRADFDVLGSSPRSSRSRRAWTTLEAAWGRA